MQALASDRYPPLPRRRTPIPPRRPPPLPHRPRLHPHPPRPPPLPPRGVSSRSPAGECRICPRPAPPRGRRRGRRGQSPERQGRARSGTIHRTQHRCPSLVGRWRGATLRHIPGTLAASPTSASRDALSLITWPLPARGFGAVRVRAPPPRWTPMVSINGALAESPSPRSWKIMRNWTVTLLSMPPATAPFPEGVPKAERPAEPLEPRVRHWLRHLRTRGDRRLRAIA
jgi:hypothetical protein